MSKKPFGWIPTFKLPWSLGSKSSRALKIDSNEASKKSPELEISSNASNIPEVGMNIEIPQVVHDTTKEINIQDFSFWYDIIEHKNEEKRTILCY